MFSKSIYGIMFIFKRKNIFFKKCVALLLASVFLFPSVIKHIHEIDHDHEIVKYDHPDQNDHFHKYESECDLCKFKLNTNGLLFSHTYSTTKRDFVDVINNSLSYFFPYQHQQLSYLLRGPPYHV